MRAVASPNGYPALGTRPGGSAVRRGAAATTRSSGRKEMRTLTLAASSPRLPATCAPCGFRVSALARVRLYTTIPGRITNNLIGGDVGWLYKARPDSARRGKYSKFRGGSYRSFVLLGHRESQDSACAAADVQPIGRFATEALQVPEARERACEGQTSLRRGSVARSRPRYQRRPSPASRRARSTSTAPPVRMNTNSNPASPQRSVRSKSQCR
jgi:hypothetical protein